MLTQIVIGTFVIVLSIIIQVVAIEIAIQFLKRRFETAAVSGFITFTVSLVGITLWLLVAMSLIIWLWAGVFLALSAFEDLEESLYFALIAFTTLGFGDVLLSDKWRLLSGFVAANGFLIFGLNTAILIESKTRLRGGLSK